MDDRDARKYINEPLESPGLVRLVKLLPGARHTPLHVELHAYHLNNASPFDVVDYSEGINDDPKCHIGCGGYEIAVPVRVYHILQWLRHDQDFRLLFVQKLSYQKGEEGYDRPSSKILPLIHRAATQSFCCVESEDKQSLKAFISHATRLSQYQTAKSQSFRTDDVFRSRLRVTHNDLQDFEDLIDKMHHSFNKISLGKFMWQSYFYRYVCHDSHVRCGCIRSLIANYSGRPYVPHIVFARQLMFVVTSNGEAQNFDVEAFSWDEMVCALLAWLLFDPNGTIQSDALRRVLDTESIRCVIHNKPLITFSDIFLRLHTRSPLGLFNPRYETRWILAASKVGLAEYEIAGFPSTEFLNINASISLSRESKQPLNLSFATGDPTSRLPSWIGWWEQPRTRLLLNHTASSYLASRSSSNEADPFDLTDLESTHSELSLEWSRRGYALDIIHRRSEQAMPPRRHCDHYVVGHNAYFFLEWFEFAQKNARRKSYDEVLLEFTDTIQARGCGHIWEDLGSTPEDRIKQAEEFLRFLEDPEGVLTNKIRIFHAACFASHERLFAVTQKGHFCLVPPLTRDGDLVCVPNGSRVPYIFRRMRGKKTYKNVGEAYVNGIMHGEETAIDPAEEQEFVLL